MRTEELRHVFSRTVSTIYLTLKICWKRTKALVFFYIFSSCIIWNETEKNFRDNIIINKRTMSTRGKTGSRYISKLDVILHLHLTMSVHNIVALATVVCCTLWNDLPLEIRSAKDINCFKSLMKTHFFRLAYNL